MPLGSSFQLNLIPNPRVDVGDGLQALSDISCATNLVMEALDVIVEDDCLHADIWKDVSEAANFLIYMYGRTNVVGNCHLFHYCQRHIESIRCENFFENLNFIKIFN